MSRWLKIGGVALVIVIWAVLAIIGSRSTDQPKTEARGAVESTGTVQAPMESTATVASSTVESTTNASPGAAPPAAGTVQASMSGTSKAPTGFWPAKVGQFAAAFKAPVWYPKHIPSGFKVDSLDVIEEGAGTGLVCDIVFANGEKAVNFSQGSPKERSYDIVSAGKTAWGTVQADVMYQDPEDKTSPQMIVLSNGGNFLELSGEGVGIAELKAIAANMTAVK